jgi:2-phosphosulfolactate phosphatase
MKKNIEVCLSPALYDNFKNDDAIVIVVDILRATSAICTAFMNGVKRIIPVATLDEAKDYKDRGFMVAAERDGIVRDFADFGNSPYNFTSENIKGREIVYSTTNGTNTIMMASHSHEVLIGAYLNHKALVEHIINEERDVIILCAGWKNKFNLEDTLFAGSLAEAVLEYEGYDTICDSTYAAMDLWGIAKKDIMGYIEKVAQRHRLKKNKLDDVLEYCHTFDLTPKIPYLKEFYLLSKDS